MLVWCGFPSPSFNDQLSLYPWLRIKPSFNHTKINTNPPPSWFKNGVSYIPISFFTDFFVYIWEFGFQSQRFLQFCSFCGCWERLLCNFHLLLRIRSVFSSYFLIEFDGNWCFFMSVLNYMNWDFWVFLFGSQFDAFLIVEICWIMVRNWGKRRAVDRCNLNCWWMKVNPGRICGLIAYFHHFDWS